ncbi:MAG TPA: efflux RND transporter permease subunit, partial [Gammaproteobacteria bacterium]|nr:efflux RND transporter permease subunit [Gammaproteobacteria bacterium]
RINITSDPGSTIDQTDERVRIIEELLTKQPEVAHVFTLVGGSIFGRSQREVANRADINVQLVSLAERSLSSNEWIEKMKNLVAEQQLAGLRVNMRMPGIRGIRTSRGDDDISLRIQGPDQKSLENIADEVVLRLRSLEGLSNLQHSLEEIHHEISIDIDRERASMLNLDVENVASAMRIALEGIVVTDFIENDRSYDVRLRLPREVASDPQRLQSVLLYPARPDRPAIHLGDIAGVNLIASPAVIMRDNQLRIVEISASIGPGAAISELQAGIDAALEDLELPMGFSLYDGGAGETLQEGRNMTRVLLLLALFLVFVVMAIQYESLRNPFIILFSVPFAVIGVALGIEFTDLPLSMPIWLGMIMLAGIVVNNAIVLVEYIEIMRERGKAVREAILEAARLRLRPIMMTTLTTVAGMTPLALGLGEGSEMLKPLAVTIVSGLSFSMLVSLVLVPVFYQLTHHHLMRVQASNPVADVEPST